MSLLSRVSGHSLRGGVRSPDVRRDERSRSRRVRGLSRMVPGVLLDTSKWKDTLEGLYVSSGMGRGAGKCCTSTQTGIKGR